MIAWELGTETGTESSQRRRVRFGGWKGRGRLVGECGLRKCKASSEESSDCGKAHIT